MNEMTLYKGVTQPEIQKWFDAGYQKFLKDITPMKKRLLLRGAAAFIIIKLNYLIGKTKPACMPMLPNLVSTLFCE